ncbi:hypothetical protein AB1Y20_019637 [Prymnesium parvum]|uniref:Uncharacterized protein n=1 Tax=Prymnesium parvum TaxID=97485 RepID=A0AB34JWH0_PRYPA
MGRHVPPADQRPEGERTSRRAAQDGVADERAALRHRIDDLEAQLQAQKEENAEEWRRYAPDNKKKRGARPAIDKDVKQRKKKVRGAAFGAMESDDSDEEGEGGQGGGDETSHALAPTTARGVETDESEVSAPILPDELQDAERAARKELTYSQRVGIAFVTFMTFYTKLHDGRDRVMCGSISAVSQVT